MSTSATGVDQLCINTLEVFEEQPQAYKDEVLPPSVGVRRGAS
jgi:hypothetical protein